MKTPTIHADIPRKAIGYVRVSTHEQAQEGVSLDAQRDKLRAYCKANKIYLVDILADEGISAGTLQRPGLQAALRALKRGAADTLLVAKLDRLTRSVRDLCFLNEEYFGHKQHHLISLCGMANTNTAAGRMMMVSIANYAQFERENNSERTREAIQHIQAQGVKIGAAPYGHAYGHELDAHGRRSLVPVAEQQAVITRMVEMSRAGMGPCAIAARLSADGVPAARGGLWAPRVVSQVLERAGARQRRPYTAPERLPLLCDQERAGQRACELRSEGLSLRVIGARLRKEGLVPPRGGLWHAASVLDLLRQRISADPVYTAQRAAELRAQGLSLRAIALRLQQEGYRHARGSHWHAASVAALLSPA